MPGLFDTISFRSITLRNRIGVSPMCQYWSDDGAANDWHLVHLGSRAVGGAALIIAEATAVTPDGRISPRDAGLWDQRQVAPLKRTTDFMRQYGAVPAIQLAHAGRKASTFPPYAAGNSRSNRGVVPPAQGGWQPLAPTDKPFAANDPPPRPMTADDIHAVQEAFRRSALLALEAGYQWLELHAAHGYLAHEFLSPLSNTRTDAYGGSLENRMRFTLECARILRHVWPAELPLSVRISATDWVDDGWTVEDSVVLARALKQLGVDLIACSSGGIVPKAPIPIGPGYQVPLAQRVREGAGIPVAAVGLITEAAQAQAIIAEEKADIVLLARQMMRDPYWPFHAAIALGQRHRLQLPPPYDYAV